MVFPQNILGKIRANASGSGKAQTPLRGSFLKESNDQVLSLGVKEPLLRVKNLQTVFFSYGGIVRAVDDVSFSLNNGEMLGIVGESGCGKSVLARSILRLIPDPPGRIVGGEIILDGQSLLTLSKKQLRQIRGNQISMIFQEPMLSLNPVFTIGNQLSEVFMLHQKLNRSEASERSIDMLRMVGIPSPESRMTNYPFQMSGGMRQRVMIAMALACKPRLILADEPTTALDVTIQAQILRLINDLRQEFATSMILITHDLGVVAENVGRVLVMYAGKVVEEANVGDLFNDPLHPYTVGLMWSVPSLDIGQNKYEGPLKEIPGIVPDLSRLPRGCYFFPRCHRRKDVCGEIGPQLTEKKPDHWVRCWLYD
jgi:peptide/nickel transport system ATP-binding protein